MVTARVEQEKEKLEKTLTPKVIDGELLRIAKVALPQIVDATKDSDQGLIYVGKLRKVLEDRLGNTSN